MFLENLTKFSTLVLAWETLQEVFVMLVAVAVLSSLEVFTFSELLFLATGTPPWLFRHVKASASFDIYPGYFWLLYFCQVFSSQFSARATVLSGPFLPSGVFYLTLLHRHFRHAFVTQKRGRNTPSRIFFYDCPYSYPPSG